MRTRTTSAECPRSSRTSARASFGSAPIPMFPFMKICCTARRRMGRESATYIAGDAFTFGGVSFRVLAPARDYHPGKAPSNNDSLVLQLRYGNTTALLEGDAESPSEARMVARGQSPFGLSSRWGITAASLPPLPRFSPPFRRRIPRYPWDAEISTGILAHQVLERLQNARVHALI